MRITKGGRNGKMVTISRLPLKKKTIHNQVWFVFLQFSYTLSNFFLFFKKKKKSWWITQELEKRRWYFFLETLVPHHRMMQQNITRIWLNAYSMYTKAEIKRKKEKSKQLPPLSFLFFYYFFFLKKIAKKNSPQKGREPSERNVRLWEF